jgi:simple sugar transport system permease protein
VFVVAAALFLYFALNPGSSSAFVSKANLVTLFSNPSNASGIAIIALGEVFLLICGEIDLSVGFVVGFAPYLMHFLTDYYGFPGLLAILFALLFGVVVGAVNGFFTVTLGLPSFITTLGTSFILLGLIGTTSHDQPASIPPDVLGIGKWISTYTIATGGNLLGAREAGINVKRIKYGNFMISGVLGALVGLQTMYFTSNIAPTAGSYTPMFYAVAAAVIGGTAMLGGSGTIIGAFFGAIVLAILLDGLPIIGVSADPVNIVFGVIVLIAMVANVWLTRVRERGAR